MSENQKKKKNITVPILASTTGLLGAATVGLGVAYGMNVTPTQKTHIEAGNIDEKIIGNNMVTNFTFTLKDRLNEGEKLIYTHDDEGKFSFNDPEVKNRNVIIPIYWLNTDIYDSRVWEGNLNFSCIDTTDNDKVLWTQTIQGARVTYEPYCALDKSENILASLDEEDAEGKTIIVKCNFTVPTGVKEYGRMHANFDVSKYTNKFDIIESSQTFEYEEEDTEHQHPILVFKATTNQSGIAECDSLKFDVQISCLYKETEIPIWISNTFRGIEASYYAAPLVLTDYFLDIQETTEEKYYGYKRLQGILHKEEAEQKHYNTLIIPADVIVVGNAGGTPIELPSTVTKIVFAKDSVLTYFEVGAFKGNNQVKFIDTSNISNKAIGLETIDYGAESFANWSSSGKIIWGSDFSYYKRHMLMCGLYSAGLNTTSWCSIAEINSESELREACETGANIKLMSDITIQNGDGSEANPYTYLGQVEIRKSLVLDLNGHKITSTGPIYDYEEKEFAIFGIWNGAEVVLTDTYDGTDPTREGVEPHSGIVEACSQEYLGDDGCVAPKQTGKQYENRYWNWSTSTNSWKPRESRCFYLRTDTPTKARTSLEIMAGKFIGNCTTIMNWNGVCWIEEIFKGQGNHEYAPEFHINSPYRGQYIKGEVINTPAAELLNCDNGKLATGDAMFEIYGGKFFGFPMRNAASAEKKYEVYDPSYAINDPIKYDDEGRPIEWADWLYGGKDKGPYKLELIKPAQAEDARGWYNLVVKKEQ